MVLLEATRATRNIEKDDTNLWHLVLLETDVEYGHEFLQVLTSITLITDTTSSSKEVMHMSKKISTIVLLTNPTWPSTL